MGGDSQDCDAGGDSSKDWSDDTDEAGACGRAVVWSDEAGVLGGAVILFDEAGVGWGCRLAQ